MKIDAISNLERAHIIHQLAKYGKWKGTRFGARVIMVRFTTGKGEVACYSVQVSSHLVISARANTVGAAVDDVNSIIRGRSPRLCIGCGPARTGMLHPVRHEHSSEMGSLLPYGEAE